MNTILAGAYLIFIILWDAFGYLTNAEWLICFGIFLLIIKQQPPPMCSLESLSENVNIVGMWRGILKTF